MHFYVYSFSSFFSFFFITCHPKNDTFESNYTHRRRFQPHSTFFFLIIFPFVLIVVFRVEYFFFLWWHSSNLFISLFVSLHNHESREKEFNICDDKVWEIFGRVHFWGITHFGCCTLILWRGRGSVNKCYFQTMYDRIPRDVYNCEP